MNYITGLLGIVLIVVLFIVLPFALIWALNVVFPILAIPYTLETWFAAVVLKAFLTSNVTYKKK